MGGKIILDLCGGTGSWSAPYKKAEYDVRIISLPEQDVRTYHPPKNVYGILAAPPCTMFSLARQNAKTPRDLKGAWEVVEHCLRIIKEADGEHAPLFGKTGKLKFWALENPVGILRRFMEKPNLTFHPYWYGDPYMKRTDLWGRFNAPKRSMVTLTEAQHYSSRKNLRTRLPKSTKEAGDDSSRRAMTPPRFAKAFFKANR